MNQKATEDLSNEEIQRYSRHLLLPEVGLDGQKKLKAASVLIIGTGGLGSPIAMYLAAAGVGCIGLVDMDIVEVSNLQRQIIHGSENVGELKIESAKRSIARINPFVKVNTYREKFTADNALDIARDYDIIIDGTDNFPTRYLVNDVCVLLGKPNVYGSIFRFEGQASVFSAKHGPCYRCLYPEPPPEGLVPNCAEGGVIGVLPGMIGTIQANEAIKIILGEGTPLYSRLLLLDALDMRFREMSIHKNPACHICGPNPTITQLIDYQVFCGIAPKTDAVQIAPEQVISPVELAEQITQSELLLIDVRSPEEHAICAIENSILIPLPELPFRLHELSKDRAIVIYCKSGIRGSKAVALLNDEGFLHVKNLSGGIKAWAEEVDVEMPSY
ncbi:MAG: molybdopterin-synthase adenylyltransferase MoeB [Cellvibrio sp.]|uniref:molybdopterin-synthase adenylyltransferase MoeB n=1 Tax=Cellvibrio sp. TaxID=1965322 RepID=UPI0027218BBE|nr:molybdopterin-synthase adenylyltransferase MoeB [Cellvibrio sp.]